MDINKILYVATFAGRIILESGGETYRVEETINRICTSFGMDDADSFVTPTGIMVSAFHKDKGTVSLIKRVKYRTVNLEKVHMVNDLSRSIGQQHMTVAEVNKALKEIDKSSRYGTKTTLFFSALGAAGFSALFGGDIKDFFSAFFIGLLIKAFSILSSNLLINDFFINSIGGAIAALLALVCVNLGLASNLDMTIIGSIMLLVPGLAITNAIRDTMAGDLVAGLTRSAEAFLIALAIAIGTGVVLSFWFNLYGGI